jgi:multidrug efflux pump subunit AcrA (membrane-fusion protein)
MSTEQPLDPQLIEQTKQQIRSLVTEIAQLSKTEISPEEFYGEFLNRVVSALAAVGGVVWATNEDGRLALQYQINLQETNLRGRGEEDQARHSRLLYKALSSDEGLLVPPHSGAGDDQQSGNPTDFLLVLGPMKTDLETVGLVEIFQRTDASPSAQKGYLRFLLQMCELAGDFLKSHQLRHFSHRQVLWTRLEDFTRVVHASLDPRETAYTIANEGRRLIECDRVSVAIRRGKRCKIEAISGQDVFDKRSNVVRLLGKLATAVTATGDAVWYAGDTRDLAPQVEKAVEEYVDEAHTKTVAILPLKRPAPPEEEDPAKREKPEPPIGALIVEQIEDSRIPESMIQRVEVVSRHSATALANAMEHQNLFLMPLWRALGKTRWILQARTLPKTLSITGAILLVLLVLALWPAKFEMEAKGTLEPVDRREVFAGIDGVVQNLLVDHGDQVQQDQLLVELRNTDLETAIEDLKGQRSSTAQRIGWIRRALIEETKIRPEEHTRLAGELMELEEKQESLKNQWKLLKIKQTELSIKSPISGEVVTWDLRNRLISRPVQRGQTLMRIADSAGPWHLELHMPENHMGNVAQAQQAIYDRLREQVRNLLQEQICAKLPEATDEELANAVREELDKVPDDQLYAKQITLLNQRLHGQLSEILKELPDGEWKDKLAEVSREESYDLTKTKLKELIAQATDTDPELANRLAALPLEEPKEEKIPVSYILATEPGKTHTGTVKEVQRIAEVRGDEGNTVLIKVAIDKQELPDLRPGATVTAKVYCGRRPLGYVLLHDLISFIQARIIFRYF